MPDIHCQYKIAEQILTEVAHDQAVMLGDYFDSWNDTVQDNIDTAHWLVESLQVPNRIHFFGNHDLAEYFGGPFRCSGYTAEKSAAIVPIIKDYVKHLKFYHYEQGFLFTHAGFTWPLFKALCSKYHLTCKYRETRIETVLECLQLASEDAWENAVNGGCSKLLAAGWDRGGSERHGGIVWCDSNSLQPIPNITQVFGHTNHYVPDVIYIDSKNPQSIGREVYDQYVRPADLLSENYCIDTGLRHYATIENGELAIHEFDGQTTH